MWRKGCVCVWGTNVWGAMMDATQSVSVCVCESMCVFVCVRERLCVIVSFSKPTNQGTPHPTCSSFLIPSCLCTPPPPPFLPPHPVSHPPPTPPVSQPPPHPPP